MANRGKFGITRDDDGSLTSFDEWPWYWRYPVALLGILASLVGAVVWGDAHGSDWKIVALIACVGSFISLCAVPEVLVLGFFFGLAAGFVWLATTILHFFFPSLEAWNHSSSGGWQWWVVSGAIIYLYAEKKAMQGRIDALERANSELWGRLYK